MCVWSGTEVCVDVGPETVCCCPAQAPARGGQACLITGGLEILESFGRSSCSWMRICCWSLRTTFIAVPETYCGTCSLSLSSFLLLPLPPLFRVLKASFQLYTCFFLWFPPLLPDCYDSLGCLRRRSIVRETHAVGRQ